jgi:starch-binding outer membrane protein, SusD/RagB family
MNHRIYKLRNLMLTSGTLLLLTISCVDLSEEPLDFPSPDNFYNSESQIVAALTASMGRLYNPWTAYGYGWTEFSSDDQLFGGDLVFSVSQGNGYWNAHYRSIGDLNPAIKALNEDNLGTSASQEVKDQLMAQARFIRAFNYFNLVRLYGDVPLITEETDVIKEEITRAPSLAVYNLIEEDLLFAVENLPPTWGDFPGRPTAGVAKGLLAKVYITRATAPLNEASNYQKARDMAADVMDDGIYSLIEDINLVFDLSNQYGPETMWSFNATDDDRSTEPQIWLPGTMANGWGDFKANRTWGEAYPEQPRKDAYLLLEDWDGTSWVEWNATTTPHIKKFIYSSRDDLEKFKTTQNIPILRYADVLLLFAEADNMVNGGPTQAAVDAVNMIIDRSNGYVDNPNHPKLTTAMSQTDFDAAVIEERNLELCFEYDRWHDLVRKRILCDRVNDEVKPNCDENDYLWPIPITDLRLNPLLTQNPGYAIPEPE